MTNIEKNKICTNCVMDVTDSNILFDEQGICERCNEYYENILPKWNKGEGHELELNTLVDRMKQEGKGKKYDCILGMSGGFDSSYMLHFAIKELKLRPLVFHIDAGWNLPVAEDNIKKMIEKLGVDLKVEKINWNEIRDMQLAFFKSGVPHLDTPQDHAFVAVLDKYAVDNDIKYILNGGNISTEVIVNPDSWSYWGTDKKHIDDILNRFGTIPIKEYPFTSILRRKLYMPYIKGVKVVKLLNYIPYIKADAEELLKKEYGWEPYSQKHFEDILTKFLEGYWLPKRFGYDVRKPQFSSLILTGQMKRDEALEKLKMPPLSEKEGEELFNLVATKLEIPSKELRDYMELPLKSYKDYKNSEKLFAVGAKILRLIGVDKLIRK